jgi:hypothetical protein
MVLKAKINPPTPSGYPSAPGRSPSSQKVVRTLQQAQDFHYHHPLWAYLHLPVGPDFSELVRKLSRRCLEPRRLALRPKWSPESYNYRRTRLSMVNPSRHICIRMLASARSAFYTIHHISILQDAASKPFAPNASYRSNGQILTHQNTNSQIQMLHLYRTPNMKLKLKASSCPKWLHVHTVSNLNSAPHTLLQLSDAA